MNQTIQKPNDDTIDLKELFFSLIAQWKLIIICILLSLLCAFLYLKITPKIYSVDAMVQVEDKNGASSALLGKELSTMMTGAGLGSSGIGDSEVEILKSRLVLGTTIQQLNLDIAIQPEDNSIFKKIIDPVRFSTNYSTSSVNVTDENQEFEIKKFVVPQAYLDQKLLLTFNNNDYILTDSLKNSVVFKGKLNQPESNITHDGQWQLQINSQNTNLIRHYILTKNSIITATNNFLNNYSVQEKGKQTGVIGLNYQGADKALITKVLNTVLVNYKTQNIANSSAQKAQTLVFLNKQLPELKQDLDEAEKTFNHFRETNNTVDITQESQLYLKQSMDLETQKIMLQEKQAELSAKYTNEHPMLQEVNAQIKAIDQKIGELNSTLKRLPDTQRRYLQLYREVEVKNQLYTNLLNTYQTLNVAKAGEIGNVRIIDTAVEPITPIKPRNMIIWVLALLLGGFLGTILALGRNLFSSGIKDANEIENEFDLPVYATVPRSPKQQNKNLNKKKHIPILAIKANDDIAIESLRSLRTAIQFALAKDSNKVIMISGAAPIIGKSFICANLAVILAQNGSRTLLIDADMRRGYLHKYFNSENQNGLSEVLSNQNTISNVIQTTDIPNLSFLARGKNSNNPSELLNNGIFENMLNDLRQHYDHIIIDTPPVLAVADATIISQFSDVNLMVVRFAQTTKKEIELTINRFSNTGNNVNGVILNDIQRSHSYGYNYNYSYTTKK